MRIIFVGRLIEAKGVQNLISACNVLWDNFTFDLVIVGDGNYRTQLEIMVKPSYSSFVKFTGTLSRPEVFKELKQSDIFVNPSYSEGLPTSVMEAALVGLPIIATDVGGTKEIIDDAQTGILIKPHNIAAISLHLGVLMSCPEVAREMGRRASVSVAAKFSWDTITKQYIDLLEEVVVEHTYNRQSWIYRTTVKRSATRRGA